MEDEKKWIQIKVTGKTENLDNICAVMGMLDNGLMIEDYSDVESELDGVYGDLIDEQVLNADRTHVSVSIYVPNEKPLEYYTSYLNERFTALGIHTTTELIGLCEDDWANSWKQYYKPIKIGERLVIVPMWEKYDAAENEIIVKMDPGMAFGTGTHETTRLCAALLEKYVNSSTKMLDVGCGSGILAICASKLGADKCFAYDIDPVAVRVARENVKDNDISNVTCEVSDLLADVPVIDGGYDVITANIVADIIIRMTPNISKFMNKNTKLIVSGIIDQRADEVKNVLEQYNLKKADEIHENGWCALTVTL